MKKEYELIHHSKIKHLNAFVINITYRNFHMHSDFELLLILDGCGKIQLKGNSIAVKPGDAILINPNEMHEIDSRDSGLTLIILQFSRHFLNDYIPFLRNTYFQSPCIRPFFTSGDYAHFSDSIIQHAIRYLENDKLFSLDCLHLSTKILRALYQNMPYELLDENTYQERKKRSDRVNRISTYIDENYLYPIRLKDLAEQEGISTTHLSHFFADNFGVTFQEYLNDKRLEQALQLIGNAEYSLASLSELSGFSDPKYLNKAFFKKFGCSLQEYKKSVKQDLTRPADNSQALQYYYTLDESVKILKKYGSVAF